MLKEFCKCYAMLTKNAEIDETKESYQRKFEQNLKYQLSCKPIRCGYQVWSLTLSSGYSYSFDVYQDKDAVIKYGDESELGPSIALNLASDLSG